MEAVGGIEALGCAIVRREVRLLLRNTGRLDGILAPGTLGLFVRKEVRLWGARIDFEIRRGEERGFWN